MSNKTDKGENIVKLIESIEAMERLMISNASFFTICDYTTGKIHYVSQSFESITLKSCDTLLHHGLKGLVNLLFPDDRDDYLVAISKGRDLLDPELKDDQIVNITYRLQLEDKSLIHITESQNVVWWTEDDEPDVIYSQHHVHKNQNIRAVHTNVLINPHTPEQKIVYHSGSVPSILEHALSMRELQVIQLVAKGHSGGIIAKKLHISVETVRTHRKSILKKLGVSTSAQAVRVLIDQNLI